MANKQQLSFTKLQSRVSEFVTLNPNVSMAVDQKTRKIYVQRNDLTILPVNDDISVVFHPLRLIIAYREIEVTQEVGNIGLLNDHVYTPLSLQRLSQFLSRSLMMDHDYESLPTYSVQVQVCFVDSGVESELTETNLEEQLALKLRIGRHFRLCPGIAKSLVDNIRDDRKPVGPNKTSKVSMYMSCYSHYRSDTCPFLYEVPKGGKKNLFVVRCQQCRKFFENLKHRVRKKEFSAKFASPSTKQRLRNKRTSVDSKTPFSVLTPSSKLERMKNLNLRKSELIKKSRKLSKKLSRFCVKLDPEQSAELSSACKIIQDQYSDVAKEVIEECPDVVMRRKLRRVWLRDAQVQRERDIQRFNQDQNKNRTGNSSNRWSTITVRIALAIRMRSPSAYEALRDFKVLQLPSESQLKRVAKVYYEGPGANDQRMKNERLVYLEAQNDRQKMGLTPGISDGILVIDEVKVLAKVAWNSKNYQLQGLSGDVYAGDLSDLFEEWKSEKVPEPTQYILQTVWRDLSSPFDIIGPHFESPRAFSSDEMGTHVLTAMRVLEAHDFRISAVVCDGASTNLKAVRELCSWSSKDGKFDPANPVFETPFRPGGKVHFIICPAHEMKNLVNALYMSRDGGTRSLSCGGISFGWKPIEMVYQEEVQRRKNDIPLRIPKLRREYVYRNSWIKLNVTPSKIMQQNQMLATLGVLETKHGPDTPEGKSIGMTKKYLASVNALFEEGMFSKTLVRDSSSPAMQSMEVGFKFFQDWEAEICGVEPYNHRNYISWQTSELLQIMQSGFRNLVLDFSSRNPSHFIVPSRVTGSVVESLFSRLKHVTGGKLSGLNYSSAKRAVCVQDVTSKSVSGSGYRDAHLSLRSLDFLGRK